MKMKPIILALLLLLGGVTPLYAWGPKGHDVVAYIAECHLSPKAARAVDRALEGHSPVYVANWMDNASHTPAYAYTKTWHYKNIDQGHTLETMPQEPKGDILTAINDLIEKLKSHELSPEEENVSLRMLIHLMGDLHCPMHAGRLSDLGGNRHEVKYFGKLSNLHSVWDSSIVESAHRWGYTEWQREVDRVSKKEEHMFTAGSPEEWFLETHALCCEIYDSTPKGANLSYDYVAKYSPMIEAQLLRGGLRLAHLLNEIYR